jgi:glutathione S-transferase
MSTFTTPAENLELHYWGGRGLMEPARNMLAIAGKTFVDGRHSAPTGDMAANLGRMPTINTSQGAIGQSSAIYFYTAASSNMLGDSTFEAAKCMEVMAHLQELKTEWYKLVPYGTTPTDETLATWFTGGANDTQGPAQGRGTRFLTWWMGRIEAGLTGTNGFAVGNRLSLADVLLYNNFAEALTAAEAPEMSEDKRSPFGSKAHSDKALAAFPRIAASVAKVAENENFKAYLAGRGPQGF